MDIEEDLILARIKKRDKEAFRYLYEYYFAKMVLFAESYLYDEEEARDLVQDLFFHLWKHAGALQVPLLWKLICSLRCESLFECDTGSENQGWAYNKLFEAQLFSGTEDVIIDEDVHRRLQEALNSLPDKCREIILLKVVEGKKNKEIAEQLNIPKQRWKLRYNERIVCCVRDWFPFSYSLNIYKEVSKDF